jgi:hypothetical protein
MSNSPRATKLWLAAAATVVLAGPAYLLYTSSSRSAEPSGQDEVDTPKNNKRPGSRRERPSFQPTSRPATEADIPSSQEEAKARPEVPVNKSMNELRQLFAAGQHTEVIAQAQALLDSGMERDQVRAYLAMAYCATGDAERAQVEAEKLPDSRKPLVETKCKNAGITLTLP